MLNVPYRNVTIDLRPYILELGVQIYNFTEVLHYNSSDGKIPDTLPFTVETIPFPYGHYSVSCATFDVPFTQDTLLKQFFIKIKTDIFPGGIRPNVQGFPLTIIIEISLTSGDISYNQAGQDVDQMIQKPTKCHFVLEALK